MSDLSSITTINIARVFNNLFGSKKAEIKRLKLILFYMSPDNNFSKLNLIDVFSYFRCTKKIVWYDIHKLFNSLVESKSNEKKVRVLLSL